VKSVKSGSRFFVPVLSAEGMADSGGKPGRKCGWRC
jgi:hypothetical protein